MERLTPLDVSNLRVEDRGLPMHVAALAILDGAALSGPLGLDALRETVRQRLHLAPRLRQVLYRPRLGLGPPIWVDDPAFDIRLHVRAREVPSPGDEAALLTLCSELNETRLDRSRPLWELWLLTGLSQGRAGMLFRLHHVIADGIAAVAMIGALFDPGSAEPAPGAPAWAAPIPGSRDLAADKVRRMAHAGPAAVSLLLRPSAAITRISLLAGQAHQLVREGPAPRVSWNVPAGGGRRLLLVRAELARARTVAHADGGTVNDVVLAAVAGGARRLLAGRGELSPGLTLKASVARSVRDPADKSASGNRVGVMIAPLPVGEPDPGRRVAQIARVTAQRKRQPPYQPSGRILQRWMVRTMSHQRLVNVLVSNLPGPAVPLRLAGTRVLEIFQIGAVQGNLTVSVGALSYAGQLNVTIVADADAVPDVAEFGAGMAAALGQLGIPPGR